MNRFILGVVLLVGALLRCYNINFPSIGYHNMKENENLSMAQEMRRTGDYVHKRVYFYKAFDKKGFITTEPQPPMLAYQILLAWRLFGENLWGARVLNIGFGLLGLLAIYYVSILLFNSHKAGLASSALMAYIPLGVYFSRNLQTDIPAFFFMLVCNYLYLRAAITLRKSYIFFGGLALYFCWLYKTNFIYGALPALLCIPFREIYRHRGEFFKSLFFATMPLFLIMITMCITSFIGQWSFNFLLNNFHIKDMFVIFTPTYWSNFGRVIYVYLFNENFNYTIVSLSLLGVFLAFIKEGELLHRYIRYWTATLLLYGMIYSNHLYQNSFSYIPFLGIVCICSVSAITFFSNEINKYIHKEMFWWIVAVVLSLSIFPTYQSLYRMFGTIFVGADVAGESLKEFTQPDERIFLYSHPQGQVVARYAQRYVGWTSDLEGFKKIEKEFGMRYLCIFPGEYLFMLERSNPKLFDYIQDNYHIKEVGLREGLKELGYLILERGEGQKIKEFLKDFEGPLQPRSIYKVFGRFIFFYVIRPKKETQVEKEVLSAKEAMGVSVDNEDTGNK